MGTFKPTHTHTQQTHTHAPTGFLYPLTCTSYGKTVSHVIVGLKTVKGTKQLHLDPTIYEAILKEKILVGDVIYIEANMGAVKVLVYPVCMQFPHLR